MREQRKKEEEKCEFQRDPKDQREAGSDENRSREYGIEREKDTKYKKARARWILEFLLAYLRFIFNIACTYARLIYYIQKPKTNGHTNSA
jgi:hypothetical protein